MVEMIFGIAHQLSNGISQQHRPLINLNLLSIRSGSQCNSTFLDRFDEARLENAHKTEWNTHVIRSWWKLEPHWGEGGGREKQYPKHPPPQTALEKLKEKEKVRGINSLLCHHCEKKQSHLKDTKYEKQRKHFESSKLAQEHFASFSVFES